MRKIGRIAWNAGQHVKGPHQTPDGPIMTRHSGHRRISINNIEYMYDTFTRHSHDDESKFLGADVYVYKIRRCLQGNTVEVEYLGRLQNMPKEIEYAILKDTLKTRI
jgi:hypothetical protein